MCTHNSVQPELVKKGPWGTLQCLNPKIRSESFLLLSRINQMILFFRILLKSQVFHLNKDHLLRGSTWNKTIGLNWKSSRWILPIKLKKHILIKCFFKNTIWYAIFEGENSTRTFVFEQRLYQVLPINKWTLIEVKYLSFEQNRRNIEDMIDSTQK